MLLIFHTTAHSLLRLLFTIVQLSQPSNSLLGNFFLCMIGTHISRHSLTLAWSDVANNAPNFTLAVVRLKSDRTGIKKKMHTKNHLNNPHRSRNNRKK